MDGSQFKHAQLLQVGVATVVLIGCVLISTLNHAVLSVAHEEIDLEKSWSQSRAEGALLLQRYLVGQGEGDLERAREAFLLTSKHFEDPDNEGSEPRVNGAAKFRWAFDRPSSLLGWLTTATGDFAKLQRIHEQCREQATMLASLAVRLSEEPASKSEQVYREDSLHQQVRLVSEQSLSAEDDFHGGLEQAMQQVERWTWWSSMLLAVTLASGVGLVIRRLQNREIASIEALQSTHQRLALAQTSDALGVFEWCVKNDRLFLDRRTCEIYGFPVECVNLPLTRSSIRQWIHPDDRVATRQTLEQAAQNGKLFKHRYRLLLADGVTRHVEVTGIFHGKDDELRMVGIVRDITQEVYTHEQLLEQAVEQSVASARAELLSRVSHELRTPLNAVLGFAQLLLADSGRPLDPVQKSWIQNIESSGRDLLTMVEEILQLAAVNSESVSFDFAAVCANDILAHAVMSTQPLRDKHGIKLVHADHHKVWVWADPHRLQQAYALMLGAASQAAGGSTLKLYLNRSSRMGNLCLEDESGRLTPSRFARSLEPMVGPPSAHPPELGLAIVEAIARRLQGRLEIETGAHGGTRLCLSVPLAPHHS